VAVPNSLNDTASVFGAQHLRIIPMKIRANAQWQEKSNNQKKGSQFMCQFAVYLDEEKIMDDVMLVE
jgi:hypothetical protein